MGQKEKNKIDEDLLIRMRDREEKSKIDEEKALQRLQEMEIINYEKAKEVCRKKVTNIYTPGFLFHTTDAHWTIKQIARFYKTGILPQELIKKGTDRWSHSPDRISLYMYIAKIIPPFWGGGNYRISD